MPPGSRIYYKFKSTAKFKTIDLVDHWVSVAELRPLIAQKEVRPARSCLAFSCVRCMYITWFLICLHINQHVWFVSVRLGQSVAAIL